MRPVLDRIFAVTEAHRTLQGSRQILRLCRLWLGFQCPSVFPFAWLRSPARALSIELTPLSAFPRICPGDVPGDGAPSWLGAEFARGRRQATSIDRVTLSDGKEQEEHVPTCVTRGLRDQDQVFCAPAVPPGLNHINDAMSPHPAGRQRGSCRQSSPDAPVADAG